jgi:hypothetical protein
MCPPSVSTTYTKNCVSIVLCVYIWRVNGIMCVLKVNKKCLKIMIEKFKI